MSTYKNKFGLSRNIPEAVARSVRRRCGFGCVVCGAALYDYDHFDPEFADAMSHDPDGIVLLCPNHHRSKGSTISRETIARHAKNPFCRKNGYSHTEMDVDNLQISLGSITADNCNVALEVKAFNEFGPGIKIYYQSRVIWFEGPEEPGAPLRLNMKLYNEMGDLVAWVENNRWKASVESFDVKITSGKDESRFLITKPDGTRYLDMIFVPPSFVGISELFTCVGGNQIHIYTKEDMEYVERNGEILFCGKNNFASNGNVALSI